MTTITITPPQAIQAPEKHLRTRFMAFAQILNGKLFYRHGKKK